MSFDSKCSVSGFSQAFTAKATHTHYKKYLTVASEG